MLLEARNLSKAYKRGTSSIYAIKDVSFKIDSGEFISIIGRSGSGKTTFLNLVTRLLEPTTGEILLEGQDLSTLSDQEMSILRNSKIGYIPQGQSTLANLTILDNVRAPFYFFKREGDGVKRALDLLSQVGIEHLADEYPAHLSGGELRRTVIARALMNHPKILIADEPTSNLDVENTKEIMQLFRKIADEGTAVLLVTHEMDTTSYGDAVYVMEKGTLKGGFIDEE